MQRKRKRIKTLDLFSGIGGFSYALHDVCQTVAYCEIDKAAKQVLRRNMKLGRIDAAPIFDNVTTLSPVNIPRSTRMITAGFPCQDVSQANRTYSDIQGARSGLFKEVVRLIQGCPGVVWVLLENSPMLIHRGLQHVIAELNHMKFRATWGIFSAGELGAPHQRRRLYLLATRRQFPARILSKPTISSWPVERIQRLIRRDPVGWLLHRQRWGLIGNSVVPGCVRAALFTLPSFDELTSSPSHCSQEDCVFSLQDVKLKPYRPRCRDYKLVFTDPTGTMLRRSLWSTPTSTDLRPTFGFSSVRAKTKLATQIFLEEKTKARYHSAKKLHYEWTINSRFLEWMMGYPSDWTLLSE